MIKADKASKIFIAKDADDFVLRSVIELADEKNIEIVEIESMKELGKMAGIQIGTACAVELTS